MKDSFDTAAGLSLADHPTVSPTVARLNLDHLRHNVRRIRELAAPAEIMAVVKADAYGHRMAHIVPVLQEQGIDRFAVATAAEGIALRNMGVEGTILVMGAPLPEILPAYERYDLDLAFPSAACMEPLEEAARRGHSFDVHVKIDTGMGRLGLTPEEAPTLIARLNRLPNVVIKGLWSHYATADDARSPVVRQQYDRFKQVIRHLSLDLQAIWVHIANSGAVMFHRNCVADFPRSLVRVGIALYGYPPVPDEDDGGELRPVMDVSTRVVHLKTVAAGTPISYAHRWRAPRRTRIATLAAGYADGYRRALSGGAQVRIRGRRFPVVGTVCMDMVMVDMGDPRSEAAQSVAIGDRALLFGAEGPTAAEVARWADTIPYEILCGISERVPRLSRASY